MKRHSSVPLLTRLKGKSGPNLSLSFKFVLPKKRLKIKSNNKRRGKPRSRASKVVHPFTKTSAAKFTVNHLPGNGAGAGKGKDLMRFHYKTPKVSASTFNFIKKAHVSSERWSSNFKVNRKRVEKQPRLRKNSWG